MNIGKALRLAAVVSGVLAGCGGGEAITGEGSSDDAQLSSTAPHAKRRDCQSKVRVLVTCDGQRRAIDTTLSGDYNSAYQMCGYSEGDVADLTPPGCQPSYYASPICNYRCDESLVYGPHCAESACQDPAPNYLTARWDSCGTPLGSGTVQWSIPNGFWSNNVYVTVTDSATGLEEVMAAGRSGYATPTWLQAGHSYAFNLYFLGDDSYAHGILAQSVVLNDPGCAQGTPSASCALSITSGNGFEWGGTYYVPRGGNFTTTVTSSTSGDAYWVGTHNGANDCGGGVLSGSASSSQRIDLPGTASGIFTRSLEIRDGNGAVVCKTNEKSIYVY